MDHSLLNAGLNTHCKIVGVALMLAVVVVLVGVNARTTVIASADGQARSAVVKAGQPAEYAGHEASAVR